MNTSHRICAFLAGIALAATFIAACGDTPVQHQARVDTRNTFFPLVEFATWSYVDENGEALTPAYIDANTGAANAGFAFPARILDETVVYINSSAGPSDDDVEATHRVAMSHVTPHTSVSALGAAAFEDHVAYYTPNVLDNDVWVRYGADNALPLKPAIGQKVHVLRDAAYVGVDSVTTPAYEGPAHLFRLSDQWGSKEYWFADGIGFVAFYGKEKNAIDVFTIELASYSIPD